MRLSVKTFVLLILGCSSCSSSRNSSMCCKGMYTSNIIQTNAECPTSQSGFNDTNTYESCAAMCCVAQCTGSGYLPGRGVLPSTLFLIDCAVNQSSFAQSIDNANTGFQIGSQNTQYAFNLSCARQCTQYMTNFTDIDMGLNRPSSSPHHTSTLGTVVLLSLAIFTISLFNAV